jgi:hypothetical protein
MSQKFGSECLEHTEYSPDLALRVFHFFRPLKKHLGGHRYQNNVEVQEAVSQCFKSQDQNSILMAYIHW